MQPNQGIGHWRNGIEIVEKNDAKKIEGERMVGIEGEQDLMVQQKKNK